MELPVLVHPLQTLRQYLSLPAETRPTLGQRDYHVLTVLLPIESKRRLIMGAVGNSLMAMEKEEIATVLRSVILDSGHAQLVDDWYERLLEFQDRPITFEPVSADEGQLVDPSQTSSNGG